MAITNKANLRTVSPTSARKRPQICEAIRAGFEDARAGRSFRPEYETRGRGWQMNYEAGRGAAVFARAGGSAMPRWPADVRLPQAVIALAIASQSSGAFLPPRGV